MIHVEVLLLFPSVMWTWLVTKQCQPACAQSGKTAPWPCMFLTLHNASTPLPVHPKDMHGMWQESHLWEPYVEISRNHQLRNWDRYSGKFGFSSFSKGKLKDATNPNSPQTQRTHGESNFEIWYLWMWIIWEKPGCPTALGQSTSKWEH